MKLTINEKSEVEINGIVINEKALDEADYRPVERDQQIEDLYKWIGEAIRTNRNNDVYLMKEDLHYLESLNDELVFSSYSTNDFIALSDDEKGFNELCKNILELNDMLNIGLPESHKKALVYLYKKQTPLNKNLVAHQSVFKKDSSEAVFYKSLSKKGFVLYTGVGLKSDCAYLTEKGVNR